MAFPFAKDQGILLLDNNHFFDLKRHPAGRGRKREQHGRQRGADFPGGREDRQFRQRGGQFESDADGRQRPHPGARRAARPQGVHS